MVVEDDAECYCEYFSCGDYKRYKMLFELFDHAVDEHLADCAEHSHS